ncbi:MAG TPA: hypothetical protein VIC62_09370 [Nakamurella sp.]
MVLATVDPVLRETALFSLLTDQPGTGVVRQDLDADAGTLRRVVVNENGVVEDVTHPAEHGCPGCILREDALPALEAMVSAGRWQRIVLALPVSAATMPAVRPARRARHPAPARHRPRVHRQRRRRRPGGARPDGWGSGRSPGTGPGLGRSPLDR